MLKLSINRKNKRKMCLFTVVCIAFFICSCSSEPVKPILQEPLPYAENALEPYISAKTMNLHYGKHHAGYVANVNSLLENHKLKGKKLDQIIKPAAKSKKDNPALFNNVAQALNHQFFWKCLTPGGGGEPGQVLSRKIIDTFGSFDAFKIIFLKAAGDVFGSGWVWLVEEDGDLAIVITSNADTPLAYGMKPLFTIDVWEHSYYLDYQNKRADYVRAILENLINWQHVEKLLAAH